MRETNFSHVMKLKSYRYIYIYIYIYTSHSNQQPIPCSKTSNNSIIVLQNKKQLARDKYYMQVDEQSE